VSVTEFMIMRELEDGNAMPMTEVAARVGLSQAGLTRGVARLTRSGRVAVVRDNEDRRVQTLRLLDPGVRALAQARGAVASQLQDVVRPVAAQRLQRLLRALDL
jgi:DNA-binding MarR family transcriptional regulator